MPDPDRTGFQTERLGGVLNVTGVTSGTPVIFEGKYKNRKTTALQLLLSF
jgi:chorismate synthase